MTTHTPVQDETRRKLPASLLEGKIKWNMSPMSWLFAGLPKGLISLSGTQGTDGKAVYCVWLPDSRPSKNSTVAFSCLKFFHLVLYMWKLKMPLGVEIPLE